MVKISIFIDGNNFYYGLKGIYGDSKKLTNFNFEKFCNYLTGDRNLISIFYYNAPLDINKDIEKYKEQQRFFDKIKRVPKFNLILCKLVKRNVKGTNNFYYIIKEDDIQMALDIAEGAFDNTFDVAIIVSGDGDFVPAVKLVHRKNKKVENVFFKKNFSSNLKQHCDKFMLLKKETLDKFFD